MTLRDRGHVARSIAQGHRPYLTVTIAPATFVRLASLTIEHTLSRGRLIDAAIESFGHCTCHLTSVSNRFDTPTKEIGQ